MNLCFVFQLHRGEGRVFSFENRYFIESENIVLSSLRAKTLKFRLANVTLASEGGNSDKPKHKRKKKSPESEPPEFDDRRKEPDRRRFSYTHHIPERRSGTERRSNNGKLQHER